MGSDPDLHVIDTLTGSSQRPRNRTVARLLISAMDMQFDAKPTIVSPSRTKSVKYLKSPGSNFLRRHILVIDFSQKQSCGNHSALVFDFAAGSAIAGEIAITAYDVAATEIHWSWPCGKPLSK